MTRSKASAAVYLLLVFLSGIVVGGFAYRLYSNTAVIAAPPRLSPEEWRRKYISDLRDRVKLNDEQVGKVQAVLDQTRERMRQLHDRFDPEMKTIHAAQVEQINSFLTEEQKAAYATFRQGRDRSRRQGQKKGRF